MKRSLTEYTDDSNSSGSERNTRQKISLDGSFETNTTSSSPNTSPTSPGYNASPYRVRTPSTPQRRILTPRRYLGSSKITDYQLQQKLGEGTFGYEAYTWNRCTGGFISHVHCQQRSTSRCKQEGRTSSCAEAHLYAKWERGRTWIDL